MFYFGRDVNINWKHGVNYLPESERDGKGRISIILWGFSGNVVEELGSPPMLTDETRPTYDGRARQNGRDFERGSRGDNYRFQHR